MRRFLVRYRQFASGVVVGALAAISLILCVSIGSKPYQTLSYTVRAVNGGTLVKTPKFTVFYEGISGTNTAGNMTIAGKSNGASALWTGIASSQWNASGKGIDTLTCYDNYQGIATFYTSGQLLRISDNASKLWVADSVIPLENGPIVIVKNSGQARLVSPEQLNVLWPHNNWNTLEYESAAPPVS